MSRDYRLERGIDVVRHSLGIPADIDCRAVVYPRPELAPGVKHALLDIDLVLLIAREREGEAA